MQGELKALQRKVGITFVFVTHDQDEALGMADRVAVFNQGRIEQIGTAEEVYEQPATAFVAGFVGSSNIVDAATAERLFGRAQAFALRPERIRLGLDRTARRGRLVEGTVVGVQYHGASTRLDVALDGGPVLVVDRANDGAGQAAGARRAGAPGLARRGDAAAARAMSACTARSRSPAAAGDHARRLSTWLWRHGHWLTLLLLLPPLAVAGRGLSRLAAGAARPQLLPPRRVLGPDRLRMGHHCAPMSSC